MLTSEALRWGGLRGRPIHMVGIKGNGMAALAALLHSAGASISGSDTGESFFTDAVIERLGLEVRGGFDPSNIPPGTEVVVHSPAFDRTTNPELLAARERGLLILSYPEALGAISRELDSTGIAGSHGKTTTTALCAVLARAIDLPATVLVPSLLPDLGDMPVHAGGRRFFVTETCEYRRHFLHFRPRRLVFTTIEAEHLDYYRDFDDVCDAFVSYARLLPKGGLLIHNADDPGCRAVLSRLGGDAPELLAYGRGAPGDYRILDTESKSGRVSFRLAGADLSFELHVPGAHNVYNATAALALISALSGSPLSAQPVGSVRRLRAALAAFRGSKRRAEVVGEAGGIVVLDDYGHHPTEIATTLVGLKSFYAGRRLVADFMPHTYSRTRALFDDFTRCFDAADELILHRIYASVREKDDGSVTGRALAEAVARRRPSVSYFEEPRDALGYLAGSLRPGDAFVTMGAGDNWKLGRALLERIGSAGDSRAGAGP